MPVRAPDVERCVEADEARGGTLGWGASPLNAVFDRPEAEMTGGRGAVADVYHRFLGGQLSLPEAVSLLQHHARTGVTDVETVALDSLPDHERERATRLLGQLIEPICGSYMSGQMSVEAAARELAPYVLPVGVWALSFTPARAEHLETGMAKLAELAARLAELAETGPDNDA